LQKRVFGPTIGTYLGKPIYKSIKNDEGKYEFDRVAECDRDGCPLDQLANGEILFIPGLIYRQVVSS